jgi:hypothetical protein
MQPFNAHYDQAIVQTVTDILTHTVEVALTVVAGHDANPASAVIDMHKVNPPPYFLIHA